MKRVLLLFVCIFFLLAYNASAISQPIITITPEPEIFVSFSENVSVTEYYIYDTTIPRLDKTNIAMTNLDNQNFSFLPNVPLPNDEYTFEITAVDKLGNGELFKKEFVVNSSSTIIKMVHPSHGVSSTQSFDLIVGTSPSADCRWSVISKLPYPSASLFDTTGARAHIIDDFSLLDPVTDPTDFFVTCVDVFDREADAYFELRFDNTKPGITARVEPNPVVQNKSGEAHTVFYVDTDEDTICRWSEQNVKFENMKSFSGESNESMVSYRKHHEQLITLGTQTASYTYYVQCQDLAELLSDQVALGFSVDVEKGMGIKVNSPPEFGSNKSVTLDITTDEESFCDYILGGASSQSFGEGEPSLSHIKPLGVELADGKYTITFRCANAESGPISKTYEFVIDTTPATGVDFNQTPDAICQDKDGDWVIEGNWQGIDLESGVELYQYSVVDYYNIAVINWTQTSSNEVEIDEDLDGNPLNLTVNSKYFFVVRVKNKAGLWSTGYKSHGMIAGAPKSEYCKETNPPTVNIAQVPTDRGINVSIQCTDDTECDSLRQYYNYVYNLYDVCSPSLSYIDPIELRQNAKFCYEVYDIFGNVAIGNVTINLSVVDNDGDGISDFEDKCPNTPITVITEIDEFGCADIERDADDDGVPDIQDNCPDTPYNVTVYLTGEKQGCPIDSDEDGMPDYWEDKYELNKTDPSDAILDKDGDGATNLEEYRAGTDPTNALDFPSKDTDGDGVDDRNDICPNTPSGVSVDTFGERAGCPRDSDGDGVPDFEDQCADTKKDAEIYKEGDKKGCTIPNYLAWFLLILGILLLLGGSGYIVYKISKKKAVVSTAVTYKPISVTKGAPSRIELQRRAMADKAARERAVRLAAARRTREGIISKAFGVSKLRFPEKVKEQGVFERLTSYTKAEDIFSRLGKLTKSKEQEKKESFEKLEKVGSKVKESEAFERLARFKKVKTKGDVFKELSAMVRPEVKVKTMRDLKKITRNGKARKNEIIEMLAAVEAPRETIKNVYHTILSYLLNSKKITKREINEILINLADKGVMTKKDVSDVMFSLEVKK
ncbi:thrombospondin type 3 repeat-containing protein [Candidatus Woesearchaeota archaeon]|nr:thrombospondin type 3 repeat-containing protein [Candidatus Woesearchaeota archaeon]